MQIDDARGSYAAESGDLVAFGNSYFLGSGSSGKPV